MRRFLEDWIDRIDVIVFCVEGDDRELYSRNMPLYFPRSEAEERVSREALPRYPGDDLGQAYDALNDISIKPSPLPFANGHTYSSMKHAPGGHLEPSWWGSSERVGMHIGPRDPESEAEHHHVRLLKHARQYDLSDISQLNVMYRFVFQQILLMVTHHCIPSEALSCTDVGNLLLHTVQSWR